MNPIDLTKSHDFCASTYSDRLNGDRLLWLIYNTAGGADSPLSCLKLLIGMPMGAQVLDAIHKKKILELKTEEWLRIQFGRPDIEVMVPNVLKHNVTVESLIAFRNLDTPRMMNLLVEELNDDVLDSLTYDTFLRYLEAAIPGSSQPLLASIYTLRFSAALPTEVDLSSSKIPPVYKTSYKAGHSPAAIVAAVAAELRRRRQNGDGSGSREFLESTLADPKNRDGMTLVGLKALAELYLGGRTRKVRATTVEREARSLPKVLDLIEQAWDNEGGATAFPGPVQKQGSPIYSPDSAAYKAIKASSAGDPRIDSLPEDFLSRTKSAPRPYPLVDPNLYLRAFGLSDPPPEEITNIEEAAFRVLRCILVYCGRRACCLYQIQLRHISNALNPVVGRNVMSIRITHTKCNAEAGMELPISYLWPSHELLHLHEFVKRVGLRPQETSLMKLAGFPEFSKDDPDLSYWVLRNALEKFVDDDALVSTHLPRITFASWWPIRVLCIRYPYLLHEVPYLECLRQHPWFSADSLNRLAMLLESSVSDSCNIARQLMGHASTGEYIHTYCRSFPLQASLHSYIAYKEGRSPGFHRLLLRQSAPQRAP